MRATPSHRFALALGLVLLAGTRPARAGVFQVTPTRIELSAGASSALLALENHGAEPLRFQVTAFSWDQREDGEMALAGTNDLVIYPSLLSVDAGASRNIRIGTTASFGAAEKAYRIFVEELPPLDAGKAAGPQVRVLTRMGIPVFLAPKKARVDARIEDLVLAGGQLSLAVANLGSVHFMLQEVHVSGRDADGAVVIDERAPAWYVLAGGRRRLTLDLDSARCARLRTIAVEATTSGGTWKQSHAPEPGGCRK